MKDLEPKENINLDGLEDCIVGKDMLTESLIYSYDKILLHFMKDGMDYEEAVEFIDYNIVRLNPYGNFILMYEETI
tara:strand:- start:75 stop:302 length:228 start_codon:yes stop_codon:yes gene_type:complete